MQTGALVALAGALLALCGSNLAFGADGSFSLTGWLFSAAYLAEFDHKGIAAVQLSLGAVAAVAALVVGGLAVVQWRRPNPAMALGIVGAGVAQLALAALTWQHLYALVPCADLGLGLCDPGGGLIPGTYVQANGLAWQVAGALLSAFGGLWLWAAPPTYTGSERFLRAAMLWNGEVVAERVLRKSRPLTIGEDPANDLLVAFRGLAAHVLAAPIGPAVWRIEAPDGSCGRAQLNGSAQPIEPGWPRVLTDGDHCEFDLDNGTVLRLDFAAPHAGALQPQAQRRDAAMLASFVAVATLTLVLLVVGASAPRQHDSDADREMLANKNRGLIEVNIELPQAPPEPTPPTPAPSDTDTSQRASGEEGKVGDPKEDPRKASKIPRRDGPVAERVNVREIGVAKALAAPQGALGTILAGNDLAIHSKWNVAMAGEGDVFDPGHGTGMGIKYTGGGGGGNERGVLVGQTDLPGLDGTGREAKVAIAKKPRRPPVPPVLGTSGQATGFCDKGDIRKNVMQRAAQFRACYESQLLASPDLAGKVQVQWTIGGDGKVSNERALSDTLGNSAVTDCVLRVMRRISFVPPESGVCVVAWPLVFTAN